jgi:hypothetical protein
MRVMIVLTDKINSSRLATLNNHLPTVRLPAMTTERIKKLSPIIKKNGFLYEEIKRNDEKCIYSQKDNGLIIAYEVFKHRLSKPHPKAIEDLKNYDKVEIFPSDEEFGSRAWTYPTLEKAEVAFDSK